MHTEVNCKKSTDATEWQTEASPAESNQYRYRTLPSLSSISVDHDQRRLQSTRPTQSEASATGMVPPAKTPSAPAPSGATATAPRNAPLPGTVSTSPAPACPAQPSASDSEASAISDTTPPRHSASTSGATPAPTYGCSYIGLELRWLAQRLGRCPYPSAQPARW